MEFGVIWGRASGDDVYTRDYTSIGAACGIAAAFRAPIAPWMPVACHGANVNDSKIASIAKAGTLFIVEEASSHFKKEQMSNIFYGGQVCKEIYITLSSRKVGTQQQFDRLRPEKQVLQPWRLSGYKWIWVWHSPPIFIISEFFQRFSIYCKRTAVKIYCGLVDM